MAARAPAPTHAANDEKWARFAPHVANIAPRVRRMAALGLMTVSAFMAPQLSAKDLGSVDTKFNLLSPDDSINVAWFADPAVEGITCYLSRAQKGGYKGALGLAEDSSDASIDCRQTGPIAFTDTFKKGEQVFRERRSLIFKALKVVRFCDSDNNALVYLAYSDKVIEGSPKNSVSAVPLRQWLPTSGPKSEIESETKSEPVTTPACRYK